MSWSWQPHPHPEVWALVLALGIGYVLALRRLAPAGQPAATRGQKRAWFAGVAMLLVAVEWPVHDLSEGALYSVHMVQHLILTLIVPPLLLLGTPAWLARRILPGRLLRVARALTRPLFALLLFNAIIVLTHWPLVVDASVGSEPIHFGVHALLVLSALVMWSPVCSPLIELPRLSYPGQMLYLFLQSLVPTVPASFLTFGSRPLYAVYERLPKIWGMDALADQRTAGLIMKLGGGVVLWVAITIVFFKWASLERDEGVDVLEWRDLERTMRRAELSRP